MTSEKAVCPGLSPFQSLEALMAALSAHHGHPGRSDPLRRERGQTFYHLTFGEEAQYVASSSGGWTQVLATVESREDAAEVAQVMSLTSEKLLDELEEIDSLPDCDIEYDGEDRPDEYGGLLGEEALAY